jgi:SMI1 / KNR4 family (SUKH-1)
MKRGLQLQQLILDLTQAKRELYQLMFDEEYPHGPGGPCSETQIAKAESAIGISLPPSYRSFLELSNGWSYFSGSANLLSAEDFGSAWVEARMNRLRFLFKEIGNVPAFLERAIPVMAGTKDPGFLILDGTNIGRDGEMELILLDLTEEEERFKDFSSFLVYDLDLTKSLIEDEKNGIDEDEEDE